MPVAVLRGMVAFPRLNITFDAGRKLTIAAVEKASKGDKIIFLAPELSERPEGAMAEFSCMEEGVVCRITQTMSLPGGLIRVVAEGLSRGTVQGYEMTDGCLTGEIMTEDDYIKREDEKEYPALVRELKEAYKCYFAENNRLTSEDYTRILLINNGALLADTIAHISVNLPLEVKQQVLRDTDVSVRMKNLIVSLKSETEIISLQKKIEKEVKKSIDKNQREYYLHEQIKVIEKELGGGSGKTEEMQEYVKKIDALGIDSAGTDKLKKEVDRLGRMGYGNPEGSVIRTYLDTVLALPWDVKTEENLDIKNAAAVLNEDHYAMDKVKESILLNLAVRNFNARGSNILCLVGPPGVGKTSIVKSIAKALGRSYARVSLGGVHDEADIRGHRKTYIGAMCGRIIKAVMQAGSSNALILLDEIDKIGSDYRGYPSAALLEVLDSEQNNAFCDHYIELPFDLSDIMFITTANTLSTISRPLLDRMDVIELSGYTDEEKLMIAKKHLFPKALEKTGMSGKKVTISDAAIREIIEYYTRESGVRGLERILIKLLSGAAKMYIEENKTSLRISKSTATELLGKRIYSFDAKNSRDEVGIVRGLAWTAVGGDTLSVEVNVMPGSGKLELTGKLGDVMKESAMTAVSYIRSVSKKYGIAPFYKTKDIHIHVPEGAVPKDGPSAGITMALAVFSALTGKKVKCSVAMTGEITLRGRVLAIGGLKEKSLAAHRAGINTVIIPYDNIKDLEEIPETIKDEMTFIPVKTMEEVIKHAVC